MVINVHLHARHIIQSLTTQIIDVLVAMCHVERVQYQLQTVQAVIYHQHCRIT